MTSTKILYFVTTQNKCPVKEFLNTNPRLKIKAFRVFLHIEEFGLTSMIPHLKKLKNTPLWEIRILGRDSARIFYATKQKKPDRFTSCF